LVGRDQIGKERQGCSCPIDVILHRRRPTQPDRPKAIAVARPIPVNAPVIKTTGSLVVQSFQIWCVAQESEWRLPLPGRDGPQIRRNCCRLVV